MGGAGDHVLDSTIAIGHDIGSSFWKGVDGLVEADFATQQGFKAAMGMPHYGVTWHTNPALIAAYYTGGVLGAVASVVSGEAIAPVVGRGVSAVGRGASSLLDRVGLFGERGSRYSVIKTPYGKAIQSESTDALLARQKVEGGAWIYRGGKLGRSAGPEGQFWSLENPLRPDYAAKYGLPVENAKFDFVEAARLEEGSNFVTREAPGIGSNPGGGIEVITRAGEPKLQYFTMPWEVEDDSIESRFIPEN